MHGGQTRAGWSCKVLISLHGWERWGTWAAWLVVTCSDSFAFSSLALPDMVPDGMGSLWTGSGSGGCYWSAALWPIPPIVAERSGPFPLSVGPVPLSRPLFQTGRQPPRGKRTHWPLPFQDPALRPRMLGRGRGGAGEKRENTKIWNSSRVFTFLWADIILNS